MDLFGFNEDPGKNDLIKETENRILIDNAIRQYRKSTLGLFIVLGIIVLLLNILIVPYVMNKEVEVREGYQFPDLRIHLHKAIPSGAGLGGGSSDASCFLKSVIKYFSLPVSDPDLNSIALSIGSDCPFFLSGAPSYATGRGEILEPVDSFLKGHYIVLMNPCLHVSTREAYAGCAPAQHIDKLRELILLPVNEWKNRISNDFETYAFAKYPVIKKIKEMLYVSGAIFSQMSGSGSSVFGIFSEKPQISTEFSQFIIYKGFV
jgi:4-diphosphocytidyl-2-C-methyl-D-erythritol kinase